MSLDGARRLAGKVATGFVLAITSAAVLGVLFLRGDHEKRAVAPASETAVPAPETAVPAPETAVPAPAPAMVQPSQAPSGNVSAKQVSGHAAAPPVASLSQFVEDNQRLISVLGVFAALSLFAGQLKLHYFAYGLSLIFTLLVVLLWIELFLKVPYGSSNWMISAFDDLSFLAVLGLVAYVFIDYREIWRLYLVHAITLLLLSLLGSGSLWAIKKYHVFDKLLRKVTHGRGALTYVIAIVIFGIVMYVSLRSAILVAPAANRVLDAWYKALSQ